MVKLEEKNMKKKISYLLIFFILIFTFPLSTFAHSGGTDANGGHHDYKNKSGLGSYHYHHGMSAHLHPNGVCPYSSSQYQYTESTPTPKPSPSISINSSPDKLKVGESSGFEFSLQNVTDESYQVTSSNTDAIMINQDNTLTAVGEGSSEITITTSEVSTSFIVEVYTVPVENVLITNKIERIQLGESYTFQCDIKPSDATNKQVTWTSSNKDTLGVVNSDSGYIITRSVGNTIITCEADNGIKDEIEIEVYEVFPESIVTNYENIILECGNSEQLEIEVLPENANNKSLNVYTEDENIATINDEFVLNSYNDGETKLIIMTANNIIKEVPISVYHNSVEQIQIDDSKLDYIFDAFSDGIIDINGSIELTTLITPENATYKDIKWESSDPNIISVNRDVFNINGTGNVTLTAIGHDNVEESINLKIVDKDQIITIIIIYISIIICGSVGFTIWTKRRKSKSNVSQIEF